MPLISTADAENNIHAKLSDYCNMTAMKFEFFVSKTERLISTKMLPRFDRTVMPMSTNKLVGRGEKKWFRLKTNKRWMWPELGRCKKRPRYIRRLQIKSPVSDKYDPGSDSNGPLVF